MTDPEGWLDERLAEAPPALRARIQAAMLQHERQPVQRAAYGVQREQRVQRAFEEELRTVAEDLLAMAEDGPPTHDTALTLLAADALITLACEWVGETEPQRLGEMR